MKKLKSIIIFSAILLTMAVLFCINASAAEWNEYGVSYTYDEDTGVMVIRGENKTVDRHTFGYGYTDSYCNSEEGMCYCWEFPDEEEPSEKYLKAHASAYNAKILIIEDGVKLESGSLCHFKNVETIILPESLTVIPSGLCYNLKNLKTVVLPSCLTEIGIDAFANCKNLTNITIPKTVKTIKRDAFYRVDTSGFLFADEIENVEEGNSLIPGTIEKATVDVGSDWVSIQWDEIQNARGYRVFIRENGKWKKLKDVEPKYGALCRYTVSELKSNTTYTFAIRPYSKFNDTTYWCPTYKKVVVTTALEDVEAKASSSSKGRVKVSWNNISSENGYQIWISEKQYSGYKKVSNYKANTTSATVKNLTSGKTYYVKVRAYKKVADGYNYSEFSDIIKIKVK